MKSSPRINLINARKKLNKDVEEIASSLSISASYYYKIERGTRNPTIDLAKKISVLFAKEIDHLFFDHLLDSSSI